MIKTMPFEAWHVEVLSRDPASPFLGEKDWVDRLLLLAYAPGSVVHTLMWVEGEKFEILGVIGLHVLWANVAESFTMLSKAISKFPVAFSREVKRVMNFYIKELKLKRMHAYVREGFEETMSWSSFMGFKIEAKLKYFGPEGDDYYLVAKYEGAN